MERLTILATKAFIIFSDQSSKIVKLFVLSKSFLGLVLVYIWTIERKYMFEELFHVS